MRFNVVILRLLGIQAPNYVLKIERSRITQREKDRTFCFANSLRATRAAPAEVCTRGLESTARQFSELAEKLAIHQPLLSILLMLVH
jgi:hypothetical protein